MTSYLDNGYNVMKYFAKFEKFIPHSIIIPSFMTIGSQMPELDWGAFLPPPPYKIDSQNTSYKLGLKMTELLKNFTFLLSQILQGTFCNLVAMVTPQNVTTWYNL